MYFGQFLIEKGIIKQEELDRGLKEQNKINNSQDEKIMIGTVLVDMGYLNDSTFSDLLLEYMSHSAEFLINSEEYSAILDE
jgi:hypothetical protein